MSLYATEVVGLSCRQGFDGRRGMDRIEVRPIVAAFHEKSGLSINRSSEDKIQDDYNEGRQRHISKRM